MSSAHVLIEFVSLVHLVGLSLFSVEPALQQLGVVFEESLITLLDLPQLKL